MLTINLEKSIASVEALDKPAAAQAGRTESQQTPNGALHPDGSSPQDRQSVTLACQALQDATKKVTEFQQNLFKQAKAQIAKLSVQIAEKILRREIDKGNYDIEAIVTKALENSPTCEDIVVHLNPDDLAQVQKATQKAPPSSDQEQGKWGPLANVRLVADPNIRRAECSLETPQGIIESFIDAQLQRIAEVLEKAG